MSHGITNLDSMVSTGGEVPWHGLGTVVDEEYLTSDEVNKIAGLEWDVYQVPAYARINNSYKRVPGLLHNVRSDHHTVVGTVGQRYEIFQNSQAPTFLDNLVDSDDGKYITAGSLFGGSLCWWLMQLPEEITIGGHELETMRTYILLNNGHDGKKAVEASIVTVRVVCNNTLTAALRGATRTTKIKHTAKMMDKVYEARRVLEMGYKYSEKVAELGDKLVSADWDEKGFQKFLDELIPSGGEDASNRKKGFVEKYQNEIKAVYWHTDNLKHLPEWNKWRALQAVADFNDHHAIRRSTDASTAEESRFTSIMDGNTLTAKAVNILNKDLVSA